MIQYIVEWRPSTGNEEYLFTQKVSKVSDLKLSPPVLRRPDVPTTIRPIVVGTIDTETGIILYREDQ